MILRWLLILLRVPVFSVASSAAMALAVSSQTVFYPIDANSRGTEIYNTFKSLNLPNVPGTKTPEVALQTSLPTSPYGSYSGIANGMIPFVQTITQTTYNTLLIVSFLPGPNPSPLTQYVVLPTEQVVALLYFQNPSNQPKNKSAFTSTYTSETIPYFSVDPKQRPVDIVSAVSQLMNAPFKNGISQVWMQTTLNGPFNPQPTNGLIKNIIGISVNNSLIQVQFQPPGQPVLTIIVAPEQVQQIVYVLNPNSP